MSAHSGDPGWLPTDETVPGNNKVRIILVILIPWWVELLSSMSGLVLLLVMWVRLSEIVWIWSAGVIKLL